MKNNSNNPFEVIPDPDLEQKQIKETADLTVKLLDQRYSPPDKILRGVHPKSHGCVKASFEINKDIDKVLQVGLFANPGKKYRAWIRFSNAAVRVEHDFKNGKNGSRGMAIKVLGVKDDVLLDDKGANNQDFLMINTSAF
ncbi:MAG: catalase, partial [Bacteroidetes bacterium]|nr:catalase [Bacteroidota bacterium]